MLSLHTPCEWMPKYVPAYIPSSECSQQVLPDYLKGLFSSMPASWPSEQELQQVSKLALLQHRVKDHFYLPSL